MIYRSNWNPFLILGIILSGSVCFGQNSTTTVASSTRVSEDVKRASNLSGEIDFETLSMYGISHELAEEFRLNLIKAIEAVKEPGAEPETDGLRQEGGGQEEEDEEDEEMVPATPGPGAFGVLSGIFGIFSGFGTLNPSRIIQSTVNFFPPNRRMHAQMVVDSLIGYKPDVHNRTSRPRTMRPKTTTALPMNTSVEMPNSLKSNSTMEMPSGNEANSTMDIVAKDVESNGELTTSTEQSTTTLGFINLHELLNMTSTALAPTNEDDEVDFENKMRNLTEHAQMNVLHGSSYKLIRPKPDVTTVTNTTSNASQKKKHNFF